MLPDSAADKRREQPARPHQREQERQKPDLRAPAHVKPSLAATERTAERHTAQRAAHVALNRRAGSLATQCLHTCATTLRSIAARALLRCNACIRAPQRALNRRAGSLATQCFSGGWCSG